MTNIQSAADIATAFTDARRRAAPIAVYPGELPATLGDAYAVQEAAIARWPENITGWKVAGIAPDLRRLDNDCSSLKDEAKKAACVKENDDYFLNTVRHGRTRNGAVYMPPFEGTLSQEAVWALKAYLETRREKPL